MQPDGEDEGETRGAASGGPASAEIELDTGRLVSFELSEEGDEVIILVKDGRTGEVVREIPPEDLRELVEKLEKFSGLFLDRLG